MLRQGVLSLAFFGVLLVTGSARASQCGPIASRYSWGNGFESGALEIAPDCAVRIRTATDYGKGFDARTAGALNDDILTLGPSSEIEAEKIPLKWRVLPWAPRTFLVPENDLSLFCNLVNAGLEPSRRRWFLSSALSGDGKSVPLPSVPPEYDRFLLRKPVTGKIVEIVRDEILEEVKVGDCTEKRRVRTAMVRVDAGSGQGLLPGMGLFAFNPRRPNLYAEMIVRQTGKDDATAEVLFYIARLRPGDSVSTRSPKTQ